jgi:hypothetical protein
MQQRLLDSTIWGLQDLRDYFAYGHCHCLALVLLERCGIPLLGLVDPYLRLENPAWCYRHVWGRLTTNLGIDAFGIRSVDAIMADYGPGSGRPLTKADIEGISPRDLEERITAGGMAPFLPSDVTLARRLIDLDPASFKGMPPWQNPPEQDDFRDNFTTLRWHVDQHGSIQAIPRIYQHLLAWVAAMRWQRDILPEDQRNALAGLPGWTWRSVPYRQQIEATAQVLRKLGIDDPSKAQDFFRGLSEDERHNILQRIHVVAAHPQNSVLSL